MAAPRQTRRRRRFAALAVALVAAAGPSSPGSTQQTAPVPAPAAAARPAATRELLNSERIERRFGSYGIEVLESDGRVRVSSLYSQGDDGRTCRTFAVVRYPERIDPAVAAEHDEIVRGGSIGAVFAAHGWKVGKTNLRYLEVDAPARVAALMRVPLGTRLAAHAYVLDVTKDGGSIEYAALVEMHHPDYLKLADLREIYGAADAAGRERSLDALLATAFAEANQR